MLPTFEPLNLMCFVTLMKKLLHPSSVIPPSSVGQKNYRAKIKNFIATAQRKFFRFFFVQDNDRILPFMVVFK